MRGGRFQAKSHGSDNSRSAEVLFENRAVVEIREVEAQKRGEIEAKQEELRQLVGASYRDLIESADSIALMKQSCVAVVANLARMHGGFLTLQRCVSVNVVTPAGEHERRCRARFYGVGSRVKYLVDTPEKIWGCLDEHMYLEAAERYLRAREVHSLLLEEDETQLLASFPLLRQQWPLIQRFRGEISKRSSDRLQEPGLCVAHYAVALAARSIIDELDSSQIFTLFLESRRLWLRAHLRAWKSVNVAAAFCELAHMIQTSLCQIGVLFLEVSTGKMPLLYSTVLAAPPGSQLFGGIPNPEKEVAAWKRHGERLESSMASLTGAWISEACVDWFRECAEEISLETLALIALLRTGKELADVESAVREDMRNQDAMADSLDWLQGTFGKAMIGAPWDCVCELLLRAPINLWETLFESLFVTQMKFIVTSGFRALKAEEIVDDCLAATPTASDNKWKYGNHVDNEWDGDARFFFTPEVINVKEKVDASLRLILDDLVSFLQGPHVQLRSEALVPFLQEQCFAWVSDVAKVIEARLSNLSESMAKDVVESPKHALKRRSVIRDALKTLKVVERALFLGRLSAALGEHSVSLPSLLGSTAPVWRKAPRQSMWSEAKSSKWSLRRGNPDDGATKLRELQWSLRQQSIAAHRMWIRWTTDALAGTLLRDLHQDECLSTPTPLKGWEETVIKSMGEDGEEVDARISVPAMPSPYIVAFMFASCREIHRIGGHVLDRAVLQLFAWELLDKVLTIYEKFMSHPSFMNSRVSERGVLQLLFDLKFLADVLSGGQDSAVGSESLAPLKDSTSCKQTAMKAAIARKRWVNKLLDDLHNYIDPIDWATYESYLWEQERRYYQSCAVLFGSLIQLKRLHTDVPLKLSPTSETNTLNMSATVPRFTYLPISAPLFSVTSTSSWRSQRTRSQDSAHDAVWRAAVQDDASSTISFSKFTSQNSQGSAKLLIQQVMGVGSKFGEVLGDAQVGRFKDKGAAAISMFGDMLPAQAAGLFSSFGSTMKQDTQNTMYF